MDFIEFARSFLFGPVYHTDRAVDISVISISRNDLVERISEEIGSSAVKLFDVQHFYSGSLFFPPSKVDSVASLLDYLADTCDELDAPLTSIQIVPITSLGKPAYSVAGFCYYKDPATRDESVVKVELVPVVSN